MSEFRDDIGESVFRNRQIDVYLGDWEPSLQQDRKPFLADRSLEVVRANLEGANYTLAVPRHVVEAGHDGAERGANGVGFERVSLKEMGI